MHMNDFENERLVDWLSSLVVMVSWNKVNEFVTRCNIGTKELCAHQCVANDPERPRARLSDGVTLNSGDLAATKAMTPVAWQVVSPLRAPFAELVSSIPGVPMEGVVARLRAKW
ncbi:hypothetical protein K503DRAFT_786646 [Rhizopogon vinicolor AM-OR11-026]|uniref:Uncharacterized protein n=1 Tax=Rhizopogon vinicolor AM-OR11-026 TaxID=1314800 RepID=A0A1B7MKU8_9AGAM|nr:hypothetical protein K503DRAFT_786646 [Rhizopogon vinicolor AM-OR11-026]